MLSASKTAMTLKTACPGRRGPVIVPHCREDGKRSVPARNHERLGIVWPRHIFAFGLLQANDASEEQANAQMWAERSAFAPTHIGS